MDSQWNGAWHEMQQRGGTEMLDKREPPELYCLAERYYISIERDDAPALRNHLRRHGLHTSEPEDAVGRFVVMEIGGEPNAEQVQATLAHWHAEVRSTPGPPPALAEHEVDTPLRIHRPDAPDKPA